MTYCSTEWSYTASPRAHVHSFAGGTLRDDLLVPHGETGHCSSTHCPDPPCSELSGPMQSWSQNLRETSAE